MIKLTKINGETFVLNSSQIACIEIIPESKIILMNKDFFIVKEDVDTIIKMVIQYHAKIYDIHKQIQIIKDIDEVDF